MSRRVLPPKRTAVLARRVPTCRACGCTDADCRGCVERTGEPCWWVAPDLCSACASRHDPLAAFDDPLDPRRG